MNRVANQASFTLRQSGMSLIELLVAVLVVLIGMVGYVTSLNYSLKSTRQSLFSTHASSYAYNVMELARVFPAEFSAVSFDAETGVTGALVDCSATSATCTPEQMVRYQLYLSTCGMNPAYHQGGIVCERSVAGGNTETVIALPNGALSISNAVAPITISGVSYNRVSYTVNVSWDDFIAKWDESTRSWVAPAVVPSRQSFEIKSDDFVVAVP